MLGYAVRARGLRLRGARVMRRIVQRAPHARNACTASIDGDDRERAFMREDGDADVARRFLSRFGRRITAPRALARSRAQWSSVLERRARGGAAAARVARTRRRGAHTRRTARRARIRRVRRRPRPRRRNTDEPRAPSRASAFRDRSRLPRAPRCPRSLPGCSFTRHADPNHAATCLRSRTACDRRRFALQLPGRAGTSTLRALAGARTSSPCPSTNCANVSTTSIAS